MKNVYFVGIGGIGMSALARYFKAMGYAVAGYDKTPSPLTRKMGEEEGFSITYTDDVREITSLFKDKKSTLVVFTPAVPEENRILSYFRDNGYSLHKRAEVLGLISKDKKALCIAGTHGKTTTTTMVAFLLNHSHVGCNAFLGGISANFGTNLLIDRNSDYVVIEADEFDRSFLHLHPEVAVITAMDADHLDIYGTHEKLLEAFEAFALQTKGPLFLRKGLTLQRAVTGFYAAGEKTDYYADRLRVENGSYVFDYVFPEGVIEELRLCFPGRVNVENATAAIAVALQAGVTPDEIRMALPLFKGVARRFDVHVKNRDMIYIDDYAHHPKEIEAALSSIREMWPDKRLTVAFQPHLYSRTNDFYPDFARGLSLADEVILLDIYPAREEPIPGVTSALIADRVTVPVKRVTKEDFPEYVRENVKEGVFVTMGAGDIDRFIPIFTKIFNDRKKSTYSV
ncbi:UDP-N-acetylmuramate--L-alanine ligase [Gabonibacter chumensis]|uniref:UDP-N-acetylmuramate--L-alanine ligase n=1 Tax=Gabonibacter chumensis TaxID=2972474 RepID=UPI0025739AF6|nr:UDP-N-acetylmuramate--L-alanine ligase [Gabonibacter chumensis]MCR9011996.1 UDP-N-acetylmuramate--L-alanine ligase [Gabonibacter chumensis]